MVRLQSVGLSKSYRRSLRDAGLFLLRLAAANGWCISRQTSPQVLDRWLEALVEEAHKNGERLYWVTLGVLGLQRSLNVSGAMLRNTWRAIQGWRSLKPVRSRIPITAFCIEGLVLCLFKEGWSVDGWLRQQLWAAALGSWLGFVCLLRPSEVLNLRVGDLSFSTSISSSSSSRLDPGMIVVIRYPKTRRIWRKQFVLCNDIRLEAWLRWWILGKSLNKPLFAMTRYIWYKHFSMGLEFLELSSCGFTLGSLRAGGATNHFRRYGNLGQLQYLGRWTSQSTLQFYLQEAFSMHVEAHITDDARKRLNTFHRFAHFLDQPPIFSWRTLVRTHAD